MIQTGTGSLILSPASGYVGIGTAAPCAGSTRVRVSAAPTPINTCENARFSGADSAAQKLQNQSELLRNLELT